MSGFEMFCERCGKRYGSEEATAAGALPLARKLLRAVGVGPTAPPRSTDTPFLRFCLACRGYSCPYCWNEDAGFCQTCVPLPEPAVPEPRHAMLDDADLPAPLKMPTEATVDPSTLPLFTEHTHEEPWVAERAALAPLLEPAPAAELYDEPVMSEPVFETIADAEAESVAEVDLEALADEPVLAETVADEAESVAVDMEPGAAEAELEPSRAMAERPIELIFGEEEPFTDPEPDITWEWNFELEDTAQAEGAAESIIEEEEAEPVLVAEPTLPAVPAEQPAQPAVTAEEQPVPTEKGPRAPIFTPLTPLGPIIPPPPPPVAGPIPRMEFEFPDAPPAYVLAPLRPAPVARPVVPLGLFDGPGPIIRPCPNCELPVSAKAHFCRRCGSAQG